MTERDLFSEFEQAVDLAGSDGPGRNSELLGRAPQQQRVSDRLRGRQQQQHAGVIGKAFQPPREALFDAGRQRHRSWQAKPAGQLRRRQPPR
jgi:hypothetical protein